MECLECKIILNEERCLLTSFIIYDNNTKKVQLKYRYECPCCRSIIAIR